MTSATSDWNGACRLCSLLAGHPASQGTWSADDWDSVSSAAFRHGLAASLYAEVQRRHAEPPPPILARLREEYFASGARNALFFRTLDCILDALRAAGIVVVLLKGAGLAESVYRSIAERPMADLDLWVRRPQVAEARTTLQALGYSVRRKPDRPPALQDALTGETQLVKADSPMVELHWKLFPGEWLRHTADIDEEEVWARSEPCRGEAVRRLSAEDSAIHLCVHLAVNHQMSFSALRTLADLDRARRTWRIDWNVVARRACAWRVSSAVWVVLDALAELFGDPGRQVPLARLEPSRFRCWFIARFVTPAKLIEGVALSTGPGRFAFLLGLVDRPAAAVRLVWRTFVPDRAWLALRYDLPRARGWEMLSLRLRHLARVATGRDP